MKTTRRRSNVVPTKTASDRAANTDTTTFGTGATIRTHVTPLIETRTMVIAAARAIETRIVRHSGAHSRMAIRKGSTGATTIEIDGEAEGFVVEPT